MKRTSSTDHHLTEREEVHLLLTVALDFVENAGDPEAVAERFFSWLGHIDFDVRATQRPQGFLPALTAHYRLQAGRYDLCRLERDFMSWGPVAQAVIAAEQTR